MRTNVIIIVLFLFLSCSNNAQNTKTNKNVNKDSVPDTGLIFTTYIIPEKTVIYNLSKTNIDSSNENLLNLGENSNYGEDYSVDVHILNEYIEPNGRKNYIESGFWDEGDDNSSFKRPIPEYIDLLLHFSDIYIGSELIGDLSLKVDLQLMYGEGLNCISVANPHFSKSYQLINKSFKKEELLNQFLLIKGFSIREVWLKDINIINKTKEKLYSLNQIIIKISLTNNNKKSVYLHIMPVCRGIDNGEKILEKLEHIDR